MLVRHVASGHIVLSPGHGKVRGGKAPVKVVEGVKADQKQGDPVQEETDAMIHCILPGQEGASLELLEDELHPPPPL